MFSFLKTLAVDESGATMIEYGLIAALVAIVMIVSLSAMGISLATFFGTTADHLQAAETDMTNLQ